ncbi:wd repeat containing protein 3 wdr3 [Holotrichia oblita]|uniref:Wd repeat containing protein 3 wdr3 n=1 Tax=Holotrichia oblita TaxID=644536 RepID=A0ACB9TW13_HOLOL|nr:wd repeat containing protein 3 wdr3 [Holotrichia oblita]
MGLTKQYLRYVPSGNFNIIANPGCNIAFVTLEGQVGRFVAVGACEHIIIWDLRLGEKAQVLLGEKSVATYLWPSPNKRNLAVGYMDGNIQIYDLKSGDIINIFSGHHSEVTALCYDNFGHKLASGSKDTDVIVWDTVAEIGLCRLSGHTGPITQLVFMLEQPVLITSSKDMLVKFWDLDTQHCFKSLVGHKTEIWGLTLMKDDQYLVTGCSDGELRIWKLSQRLNDNENKVDQLSLKLELAHLEDSDDNSYLLQCHKAGSLLRQGKGRVVFMHSDESGQVLACHGTDMQIEIFYFCTDNEAQVRLKKRIKKEKKRQQEEPKSISNKDNLELTLKDEVKRLTTIKLSSKPKSLHTLLGNGGELRVSVVLSNNTVELYSLQVNSKQEDTKCLRSISTQGHHSEVRAVAFSSDNLAVVSGSAESVKIWNKTSQACLRSVKTGYVLSLVFVPGDRHILAGLKSGTLLIIDISAGDILEEISAHSAELWSICQQPSMRGCATGGGDNTVKFWQFELIVEAAAESKTKVLSLLHTRTLKLEDSVLCVRISPNSKFVAVALLDSTVKIFFLDSFKFYLSLYGHKLPVLSMDISSDSALIATGSADRNLKIWGMDFGDCHKSIFAHDDSITAVQFIPRTHFIFSCGKDGKVKQWDADAFVKITTLQGHAGEAWNLSVSPNGQHVVSCGSDKVLRMYEKTEQVLVLQDEEEEEREEQDNLVTGEQTAVPGQPGLNLPSKKTVGSEKAAESILECLEVCEKYKEQLADHAALQAASTQALPLPTAPPLMQALNVSTPNDYFLETIKRIRTSDLEEALILLPFPSVCEILQILPALVMRGDNTELVCRLLVFLLKIHHTPIVANNSLLSVLKQLQKSAMVKVEEFRDLIGYNYHGMQFLQHQIENSEGIQLFRDIAAERSKSEKKRKTREKLKRSVMVLNT